MKAGQESVTWSDGSTEAVSDAYVRLSSPANITGVPALSVPVGHDTVGMPIGMQLLGRPFGERQLLRVGPRLRADTARPIARADRLRAACGPDGTRLGP
ncbi:hypothetical protein LV779_36460 [Streptomyces thinghirensis]|nr:hypothetical protein [Streptomyces thinghirensis]